MDTASLTEETRRALEQVRDSSHLNWYVVTFLGLVLYVYGVEVERKRWDVVCAGLAFILADVFNELVNSAWLHVSGVAPLWAVTGSTYLVLVGWGLEIIFLFLISGIVFVKFLPADRSLRVLGVPNRWFFITLWSVISVVVELLLHAAGIFHWHWAYWNQNFPLLIVIFGYGWFFWITALVYDLRTDRRRVQVVAGMAAVDAVVAVAFGLAGWL